MATIVDRAAPAQHAPPLVNAGQMRKQEDRPAARFLAALAELELAEGETGASAATSSSPSCPAARPSPPSTSRYSPACPPRPCRGARRWRLGRDRRQAHRHRQQRGGQDPLLCAICHALVEVGRRVLYTRTTDLVKKEITHRRALRDPKPRHRRQSGLQRLGPVFRDRAVTIAALDRVVHCATMLDMNSDSDRGTAADRAAPKADAAATTFADNHGDQRADRLAASLPHHIAAAVTTSQLG